MILRTRSARALVVGGVLLAATSLAGCGQIDSLFGGAQRDSDTNEVTEAGTDSVFDIQVGDCIVEPQDDDASASEISELEVVPCTEEHEYELYHAYDLDLGEEFPAEEELKADADQKCYDAFTDFVGIPVEESASLYYSYYSPSADSWADGDRQIQCLVYEGDDSANAVPITGSLKGSKR